METSPAPWIDALRHSHDTLPVGVEPSGVGQLTIPSYGAGWSIAQILLPEHTPPSKSAGVDLDDLRHVSPGF